MSLDFHIIRWCYRACLKSDWFEPMTDYRFIDKDPIIDELRTIISGKHDRFTIAKLAETARLSPRTLMKIFYGDTKRPQNYTIDRILIALGYERKIIKSSGLRLVK